MSSYRYLFLAIHKSNNQKTWLHSLWNRKTSWKFNWKTPHCSIPALIKTAIPPQFGISFCSAFLVDWSLCLPLVYSRWFHWLFHFSPNRVVPKGKGWQMPYSMPFLSSWFMPCWVCPFTFSTRLTPRFSIPYRPISGLTFFSFWFFCFLPFRFSGIMNSPFLRRGQIDSILHPTKLEESSESF